MVDHRNVGQSRKSSVSRHKGLTSVTRRLLSAAFVVIFWASFATGIVALVVGVFFHNFLGGAPTYLLALFSFAICFVAFFVFACSSLSPSAGFQRPAWPLRAVYWIGVIMIWAGTAASIVTMCFSWYASLLHSELTEVIAGRVREIQEETSSMSYTFVLDDAEFTRWCKLPTQLGRSFEVGDSIHIRYVPDLPQINRWVEESINRPKPSASSPLAAFLAASARYTTAGIILLFLLTVIDGRNAGYLFESVMNE